MALSGSSNRVFGSQNSFRLAIEWSATQNIGGNSSTVTAVLYLQSLLSWASFSDGTASGTSITINGNTKTFNANSSINGYQKKELGRHSVTVGHNGDGTKTFSISAVHNIDITYSGSWLGSQSTSGSYTLNTIPRASSVTVNKSSADIGSVVRLSISRASTAFTHTMTYDWGGNTGTIASRINYEQHDWTVPTSFLNIIKNASSGWGTIKIETYSGNTLIGTSSTKLTTTVPSNIVPTTSSVSITDKNTAVNNLVGASVYVQGLSDLTLAINGASGASGSTITSYTINFDGRSWGSQTANVGKIAKSGVVSGSAYVTDSRGRRSASRDFSYTLLPYAPPTVSSATVTRTGGGLGENILIKRVGRISGLGGKNKYTAYLDYKEKSSATWINLSAVTVTGAVGVESFSLSHTSTGNLFLALKSYDFRINIHDSITMSTASTSISTASATLSFGKNGVGIGKIHEGFGALEVAGIIMAEGYNSIRLPVNANLNSYTKAGWYHTPASADAITMTNSPTPLAFSLFVEVHAGVKQTLTEYRDNYPRVFIRNMYNGYWGAWEIWFGEDYSYGLAKENGWGNYGGVYQSPAYSRTSGGLVTLSGMLEGGTRSSGVRVATLPVGFRPRNRHIFNTHAYNNTFTRIDVTPEGYVLSMGTPNGYVSLGGISFLASRGD